MSYEAVEWVNLALIVVGSFGAVFMLGSAADRARRDRLHAEQKDSDDRRTG